MRRHLFLSLFLIIIGTIGSLVKIHAGEVINYTESFTGLNTSKHDFAPASWGHIVESAALDDESYVETYVSYTAYSSGGQSGAYLKGGSQTLSDWYSGISKTVNDLLVTPLVKGSISFYIKKNGNTGSIRLFSCTKSGTKFNKGDEIPFTPPTLSTTGWTQVTVTLPEEYSYIGFRLDDVSLDEFSATNASIEDLKAIEITSATLVSPSTVYADKDGNVTIHASFEIRNSGNVVLKANEYSFQMEKRSNPILVMTPLINGPKDLAVGETTTIDATCRYTLADKTKGDRVAYDIRENLGNTTKQIYYVEVIGYVASLDLRDAGGATLNSAIDFETFKGERGVSISLKNTGGAPLIMTGVRLPEGFSMNEPEFTLLAGQSAEKVITLGGKTGFSEGNVEFIFDGEGSKSFTVKGTVVGQETWFEDFENGLPTEWIIVNGANWAVTSDLTTPYSKKSMANSVVSPLTSLISPKVTVTTGESLNFFVARKSQYTPPVIQIRYSDDRQNWSEPIAIPVTDLLPSSEKGFRPVTVSSIPAGDHYISFEAGYIFLDNIYGYKLAGISHDLYINSFKTPSAGTVNNPVETILTVTNMTDKPEAAGSYSVKLLENGKVVAEAVTEEFPAKDNQTFRLNYTPHVTGTHSLVAVITAGSGYTVSSNPSAIIINNEIAANEKVVGVAAKTTTDIPLRLNYYNSLSETVYAKEQLNLTTGSNIIKIAYPYFSTATDEIPAHVTLWLENTTDVAPSETTISDTTRMIKVFHSQHTFAKGGSASELLLTEFSLSNGFNYTGGNLRVIIKSGASVCPNGYSFGYDPAITNSTNYKYKDPINDFAAASVNSFTSGLPVIHLFTAKAVPAISGKVATDNIAVEGATVSLTSGEVIYHTTTNTEGFYSLPVYQANKEYVLSIDKIGYIVTRSTLAVSENNITVPDIELEATGAKIMDANHISASFTEKSVALEGEGWTAANIASLSASLGNNPDITGIDMSHIDIPANITVTFDNINPNCLIYMHKDAVIPTGWKNIIKGYTAENIILENKAPFSCIKPFIAKNISYSRKVHATVPANTKTLNSDVMETICLPFTVTTVPAGCSIQEYTGNADSKVSFTTMTEPKLQAKVPYLLKATGGSDFRFEAVNAELIPGTAISVENGSYTYRGTFIPITDGAANDYYVFDGIGFLKAGVTSRIPAFRGYFEAKGMISGAPMLSIDIDGEATHIDAINITDQIRILSVCGGTVSVYAAKACTIRIYGIDGRLVRSVAINQGNNRIGEFPQGVYLINNQKVIIK